MNNILPVHQVEGKEQLSHDGPDILLIETLPFNDKLEERPVLCEIHHHRQSEDACSRLPLAVHTVQSDHILANFELS